MVVNLTERNPRSRDVWSLCLRIGQILCSSCGTKERRCTGFGLTKKMCSSSPVKGAACTNPLQTPSYVRDYGSGALKQNINPLESLRVDPKLLKNLRSKALSPQTSEDLPIRRATACITSYFRQLPWAPQRRPGHPTP